MTIQPAQAADTQILDQLMKELMGYEHQWDDNINPNASTAGNYAQLVDREDCRLLIARRRTRCWAISAAFSLPPPSPPSLCRPGRPVCAPRRPGQGLRPGAGGGFLRRSPGPKGPRQSI